MRGPWPLELPVIALAILLPLGACALDDSADTGDPGDESDGPADDPGDDPDGPDEPAAFRTCTAMPYAPGEPQGFEHTGNQIVVVADQAASLTAIFQYSAFAVDIADEAVKVSLDTCDGWRDLGELTTDDD